MDGKYFNTAATYLDNLDIFPYFNVCHYVLVSLYVRQLSPGNKLFSRQHPLCSWTATMLMCFAGSFLSNLLVGEPLIVPLKAHENILHASICWYLINYFPFDLFHKICSFIPIYISLSLAKELYRARMVHIGVAVAAKRYPDSTLIWLLIGLAKGCGEDILIPIAHASMGILDTRNNVLLNPTFNVKGSLACAVMFTMEKLQKMPLVSNQMFFAAVLFLAYFRVSSILVGIKDPFVPFENLACGLFFGGLVDSIKAMSANDKERAPSSSNINDNEEQEEEEEEKFAEDGKGDVEDKAPCNCDDSELRSRQTSSGKDHQQQPQEDDEEDGEEFSEE